MGSDFHMNPPQRKIHTQKIRIEADGQTVRRLLYDDKVTLWQIAGDTITVKEAGGKYWMGIGLPQGYAPAKFVVYRVHSQPDEFTYEVSTITEFPVQAKPSKAKA